MIVTIELKSHHTELWDAFDDLAIMFDKAQEFKHLSRDRKTFELFADQSEAIIQIAED